MFAILVDFAFKFWYKVLTLCKEWYQKDISVKISFLSKIIMWGFDAYCHRKAMFFFCIRLWASRPYRAPPPPSELPRVGSFFSYRCLVFPKKCPQRKAWIFRSYLGLKSQKRGFSAYSLKPNFNKLNIFRY